MVANKRLLILMMVAGSWLSFFGSSRAQTPELQGKIDAAIDKGIAYLKKFDWKRVAGNGQNQGMQTGAMALAGWTLLESGVDPADGSVQFLADEIRRWAPFVTHNYSISLSLIFLDKLGDPGDFPLIESLTVRLIHAQNRLGGWSYRSADLNEIERNRLDSIRVAMAKQRKNGQKIAKQAKLSPEIVQQLEAVVVRGANAMTNEEGDNSNTQFAVMALWVARRHGLPVHRALAFAEQRFRWSQTQTGGWAYIRAEHPKMAMTCAGLLGIAIGQGNANDKGIKKNLLEDPVVKGALEALGTSIKNKGPLPIEREANLYYFLFSLERMAVIYDLKQIGDTEWYPWGADYLVRNQSASGEWKGAWADSASDTCFAVLFLKRANVATDLTANLQGRVIEAPKKEPASPKLDPKKLFEDLPQLKGAK